jgi:hypothetical protein
MGGCFSQNASSNVSYCIVDFNFFRDGCSNVMRVTELSVVSPKDKRQQTWFFTRQTNYDQLPLILDHIAELHDRVYVLGDEKAAFIVNHVRRYQSILNMQPMLEKFPHTFSRSGDCIATFPCCMYHSNLARYKCTLYKCFKLACIAEWYENKFADEPLDSFSSYPPATNDSQNWTWFFADDNDKNNCKCESCSSASSMKAKEMNDKTTEILVTEL